MNERAIREIERLAQSGHTPSQEEVWIYRVNRGRLLLQGGRVDEAETMLQEALSHIHPRRRMFHMFAHHALDEIQQGRAVSQGGHYQLDWRWIGKYREIAAFDSLWWLSPCGPLTGDEEREWQAWKSRSVDELERRQRLQAIVLQARHRELTAAHAEQREPRFAYPVIPIDDVLARLAMLEELNEAIAQHEPNALVRRFYAAAIEEQRWFLNMIKATHEGNNQAFMESNQHLHPAPTENEMRYTLSRVAHIIQKGCQQAETQELAQQVYKLLQMCLLVPSDFEAMLEDEGAFKTASTVSINTTASNGSASSRQFAPHIVQHFLETVLQDCGYDQWSVTLDASAQAARIEQGLRTLIIPAIPCTVAQVRSYLVHELGGHVARAVAGERSPLGLLGIGTKQNLVTEEGLALFLEQRTADIQGIPYDESRLWLGTLATGMASGVLTHPQTFRRSLAFFELFLLLYRLLRHSDQDMQAAQKRAHDLALLRCLRTYRGVPDLTEAGMCSTKDAVYLRGYHLIERAFAKNEAILDRLTVGVVAIEDLPDLDELHLTAPAYPPARVALDPSLETRLIAFEQGHIGKEVS